jgi:hypothetical protein
MSSPADPVKPIAQPVNPKNASDQKNTSRHKFFPFVAKLIPNPKREKKSTECKPDATPWWKYMIEFSAILVGLYVAVIYTRQLQEMIDGNTFTRMSLRAELKVTPDDFSIFPMINGGREGSPVIAWDVMIPMENIGNTRTKNLSYLVSADILTPLNGAWTGVPQGYEFPQRGQIVHGNISGHAKMSFSPFPIGVDTIEKIQKGTDHILFHGWARYHDIFANTPEHLLMFCYEMTAFAKDAHVVGDLTKAPPVLWGDCNRHNCEDDECKKETSLPDDFKFPN